MKGLLYQIIVLGSEACNIILNGYTCLDGTLIVQLLNAVARGLNAETFTYGSLGPDLSVECLVQHVTVGYCGTIGRKCGVIA